MPAYATTIDTARRQGRPFAPGSTYRVAITPEEEERLHSLPLRSGDRIAFDPCLLYFSDRDRSRSSRRAIVYAYKAARLGDLWSNERHPDLAAAGAAPSR